MKVPKEIAEKAEERQKIKMRQKMESITCFYK
jgi:hypothetical protein